MSMSHSATKVRTDPRVAADAAVWAVEMAAARVLAMELRLSIGQSFSPHGSPRRCSSPREPTGGLSSSRNSSRNSTPRDLTTGDPADRCQPKAPLEPWAEFELGTKRLMEVAHLPRGGTLSVSADCEIESDIVAQLNACQLLKVLGMRELDDGTKRALIVLVGPKADSTSPLGWVTSTTADGEPLIHVHARPSYVVVSRPLKVRRSYEETSTFVAKLPVGARLHVVETRRTSFGKQRWCVVVHGDEESTGWVTAQMASGSRLVREMMASELSEPIPAAVRELLMSRPSPTPVKKLQQHPTSRRTLSCDLTTLGSSSSAPSARKLFKLAAQRAASSEPAASSLLSPEPPFKPMNLWQRMLNKHNQEGVPQTVDKAADARKPPAADARAKAAHGHVPAAAMNQANSAKQADNLNHNDKKQDAGAKMVAVVKDAVQFNKWAATASNVQVNDTADVLLAERSKYLSSVSIEAVVAELTKKADDARALAGDRDLSQLVGEILQAKRINVQDLMHEWDPNKDGSITKMEFRQNLRGLFPKNQQPDTKDVDALFTQLDDDGSAKLEMDEVKVALRRFRDAAAKAASHTASAHAHADDLQTKAEQIIHVVEMTRASEQSAESVMAAREGTAGSQIGDRLNAKGLKEADLAQQWDPKKSGEISRAVFVKQILALVPLAVQSEVNQLFDSLDQDGGGALDKEELKAALKKFKEEAVAKKLHVREMNLQFIPAFKAMRMAQADYLRMQKTDGEAAKEEEARRKREEEERAGTESKVLETEGEVAAKAGKVAALAKTKAKKEAQTAAERAAEQSVSV